MNKDLLTKYLDSLLEEGIPSVDCMVYKNHELIYRHMKGLTDPDNGEEVSDEAQYLMFSMTKVQTMTAFMQLVEKGLISLEDDVSKYLPAYGNIEVFDENTKEVKKAVNTLKVKHLLSMQSGLDYDLERPGIKRVLGEKGLKASTREVVDAFVESPLLFEPGTHFNYSLSHDVAAAIIEVVSGMSFGEYLKKNIWEPLGMQRTFFAKPLNDDVPRLAKQYIYENETICPMEKTCKYQLSDSYESGGAGLISCTKDYACFADTLACGGIGKDGVRIIKPETIEIMKTNLLCEAGITDIDNKMGRKGYGYGCGVQVLMHPEMIGSPAPKGLFGWDGAAGSCIIMDTVSKTSLVYTMHIRGYGPAYGVIHPALRDMVFGKD